MATLTRYLISELLKVLVLWLVVFSLVFVFSLLGLEVRRGGINPAIVLKLVPFILPQALVYAIPATILLAVCVVYGRISSANEVVALKSLGISPWSFAWPAYALAFVLSLVCVYLNDLAYSWAEVGIRRVIIQSVEEIVYGMLETQRTYSNQRISISVHDVRQRRLMRPVIVFHGGADGASFTITAEEAELSSNLQSNTLRLILTNSVVDGGGSLQGVFPGRTEREIPLAFASTKNENEGSVSQLPLRDIPEAIESQRQVIHREKQLLAAQAGMNLMSGEILELNEQNWQSKRNALKNQVNRLHRLEAEIWRRTASGFMCLSFALVGVPLAVYRRNADFMTNFGVCFMPILICYFPLFFASLNYAKEGVIPPAMIWLANIACALIGWRLWRWVVRY